MRRASRDRDEHVRIEQPHRQERAARRADPEAAVDGKIDASAQARRDQFLDRRIDGRIFAADAGTGEEAEQQETVKSQEKAVSAVATR